MMSPILICLLFQDTLREDCDRSDNCLTNCCVSPLIAPVYFVVFVLMAQFVLVNVVVAVLMKHLEVSLRARNISTATTSTLPHPLPPCSQYISEAFGYNRSRSGSLFNLI